jgi:hypothetical protein
MLVCYLRNGLSLECVEASTSPEVLSMTREKARGICPLIVDDSGPHLICHAKWSGSHTTTPICDVEDRHLHLAAYLRFVKPKSRVLFSQYLGGFTRLA